MVENSKHVRVDNWGIFFLQRLQVFFSKTDFCDLTLQFEGNVQLKVHRLVMNACTDYFQYLESSHILEENVIIMPRDLQADVIVPIVNFMYTGTLQYQLILFDKLYKAADMMNINVLTKLLDAQRPNLQKPNVKKVVNAVAVPPAKKTVSNKLPQTQSSAESHGILPLRKLPLWKRKPIVNTAPLPPPVTSKTLYQERKCFNPVPDDPLFIHENAPKPTRFEWPEDDENLPTINLMDTSFDDISYTSKPLLTQDYEAKARKIDGKQQNNASKKHSTTTLEDGKYSKEVKHEEVPDEFIVNAALETGVKRKAEKVDPGPYKKTKKTEKQVPSIHQHTKIISEILKKYPQLVKQNKNIRLKIMAKNSKGDTKLLDKDSVIKIKDKESVSNKSDNSIIYESGDLLVPSLTQSWVCHKCNASGERVEFVLYYLYYKHMTDVHGQEFDSLVCKYCGRRSENTTLLAYHQYTKHGIRPVNAKFPKCERCPYIAVNETSMKKHKPKHTIREKSCIECLLTFSDKITLNNHMQTTGHSGKRTKNNYDCQYCTKKYQSSINLFSHIKLQHKAQARNDGVVSIDENDEPEDNDENYKEEYILPEMLSESTESRKVKILSDVKVDHQEHQRHHPAITLEPSSEAEALSNVATGIATSLGLVDIVVLDDNQQYILQSGDQQFITHGSQQEYILPEMTESGTFVATSTNNTVMTQAMLPTNEISTTDELVMVLADHDEHAEMNSENSNIVVLYSHPVGGEQGQFITTQDNLMVNSQTGLLEIRNDAQVTSSPSPTSDQLIVATQESHSNQESIEMIQKEVDRHVIESKNSQSVSETEMIPEKIQDDSSSTHDNKDEVSQNEINNSLEEPNCSGDVEAEAAEDLNDMSEENYEFESIKPDDSLSNIPADNILDCEMMGVEEERVIAEKTSSEVEVSCPQESVYNNEETIKNKSMEVDDCTEKDENGCSEIIQGCQNSENQIEIIEENEDMQNEAVQTTADEPVQNTTDIPVLNPEDNNEESENLDRSPPTLEIAENKSMEDASHIDENPPELLPESHEHMEVDDHQSRSEIERFETHNSVEVVCDSEEVAQNISVATDISEEENQVDMSECNEQIEEEAPDEQETTESKLDDEEMETLPEAEEATGVVAKNQSEEQGGNNDENSQESRVSNGCRKIPEGKVEDSAKISILDDWEDTDSQQSNGSEVMKAAGETVNKLMDDWEEDDDDEKV